MRKGSRIYLVLVGLLAGSGSWVGCATSPKVSDGSTFSEKAILMDVPFKGQKDANLCGLAVVEMIVLYYEKPLPPESLLALKKEAAQQKGITGKSLAAALQKAGYYTAIFAGTLDKKGTGLYTHLDRRRPLIVMLSPEGAKEKHYQLVTGYDPKLSLVSLLDPAKGPLAMPLASFKASWERANYFSLLAVPESQDQDASAR